MILLAAMDPKGVIGKDNKLPWSYPQDMKHFKETTSGQIVVMGRNTWDSLPKKPLPNRINIVVSRNLSIDMDGVYVVKSIEELCTLLDKQPSHLNTYLIGGSQLYQSLFPLCDDLIITHIKKCYPGDTYFNWNWNLFEQIDELYQDSDIRIIHYRRIYGS